MADVKTKSYKDYLNQLEGFLDEYLIKKAPALPPNIIEVIVKFLPIVTVILIILALPFILAAFGLSFLAVPAATMWGGFNAGLAYIISLITGIVSLVLEALALPGLFKTEKRGWTLLYYSMLISIVGAVLTLALGGLVIDIILLYILFQIKSSYK